MKDEFRNTLLTTHCRKFAVDNIQSMNSSFLTALRSKGVFTSCDEERVKAYSTTIARNEMILNLVARKSQSAYFDFMSALYETRQTHVVDELIGAVGIAKIKALYDSEGANGNSDLPNAADELLQYIRRMVESNETVISPQFVDTLEIEKSDDQFENSEKAFDGSAPMTSEHRSALESSTLKLADKLVVSDDLLDELSLHDRTAKFRLAQAQGGVTKQLKGLCASYYSSLNER